MLIISMQAITKYWKKRKILNCQQYLALFLTMYFTVPVKPKSLRVSYVSEAISEAILQWSKPDGGDEIDGYLLTWTANSTKNLSDDFVRHEFGNNSYLEKKSYLTPGEFYIITVRVNNTAGSENNFTTHRASK